MAQQQFPSGKCIQPIPYNAGIPMTFCPTLSLENHQDAVYLHRHGVTLSLQAILVWLLRTLQKIVKFPRFFNIFFYNCMSYILTFKIWSMFSVSCKSKYRFSKQTSHLFTTWKLNRYSWSWNVFCFFVYVIFVSFLVFLSLSWLAFKIELIHFL